MTQLIAHGRRLRGYLGVKPQDISPQLAQAFQLKSTQGFKITSVAPKGPARIAGLWPGDAIETIDGQVVMNNHGALNRIARKPPRTQVVLGGTGAENGSPSRSGWRNAPASEPPTCGPIPGPQRPEQGDASGRG